MESFFHSFAVKLTALVLLFFSGAFALLGGIFCASHLYTYGTVTAFEKTAEFQRLFLKYVERTSVYVRYRELGYSSTELPADLSSLLYATEPASEEAYLNVNQITESGFSYYDRVLNEENVHFLYYVKNTSTGAVYSSPALHAYISGRYDTIEDFLSNIKAEAHYLVFNTANERYITNINDGYQYLNIQNLSWAMNYLTKPLYIDLNLPAASSDADVGYVLESNSAPYENEELTITAPANEYILYACVMEPLTEQNDVFSSLNADFLASFHQFQTWSVITPLCTLLFLISLALLLRCAGYKKGTEGICLNAFDRIPSELAALVTLLPFIGLLFLFYWTAKTLYTELSTLPANTLYTLLLFLYGICFVIGTNGLLSLAKRLKAHTLLSNSLLYRLFFKPIGRLLRFLSGLCKEAGESLPFLAKLLLLLLAVFALLLFDALFVWETASFWNFLFRFLFLSFLLVHIALDYRRIRKGADELAAGGLSYQIDTSGMLLPLKELAAELNQIRDGLSHAVDEQTKSEHMKTELITNVSHDIKTPLTSILNYVDLLQREELENETAKEYLRVLSEKSWRLKRLIDDLVEASKVSSGVLPVTPVKLNGEELIKQALGEWEERFQARSLTLLFTPASEPLFLFADGQYTYRIIENLLSNACKYAMPHTRVYLELEQETDFVLFSVKNISETPLMKNGHSLIERFVRGDASRTTEGSGLGLSIADGLAKLQNGSFQVQTDGDLFKAVLKLPLYKEEQGQP